MHNLNIKKIFKPHLLLILLIMPLVVSAQERSKEVKLATSILEPYQKYDVNEKLTGLGIEAIKCIERNTQIHFSIDIFPWKRAQELVKLQKYDGFFVGSKNAQRGLYAKFVGPFITSYWDWYIKQGKEIDITAQGLPEMKGAKIGVVLGTNMHQWISKFKDFHVIPNESSKHVFELLELGKVDYVLATEPMYLNYKENNKEPFNSVVAKSKPLGIYLGHHFIKRNPELLKEIENSIAACAM